MVTDEHAARESASAGPWAHLLDRHRADWVAALAGERSAMWLDDYAGGEDREHDAETLRAAVAEGRPVVVGLPADAGGAAAREADRLASELGGVTVAQRLAAGSLISAGEADAGDVVHYLVCVNVDPARAEAASAMTDADAAPLLTGYVRFLEEANRSLTEANARLARQKLGVHDSAAGALEPQVTVLKEQLAEQRELTRQAEAALQAPRYRAVDRLRAIAFGIPGLSRLLRLRRSLIQRRHGSG
jgi:hypothetical protein